MRVEQRLIVHEATCEHCSATCYARNAQAWATNHVRANPAHVTIVTLAYRAADRERSA